MENPPDFDVWGNIHAGMMKSAATWTARMHAISPVAAYMTVREALQEHGHVQIAVHCGWEEIASVLQDLPAFVQPGSCIVSQSTYLPAKCAGYCVKHGLHYVRQTCPVCDGDYISHVINGKLHAAPRLAELRAALEE